MYYFTLSKLALDLNLVSISFPPDSLWVSNTPLVSIVASTMHSTWRIAAIFYDYTVLPHTPANAGFVYSIWAVELSKLHGDAVGQSLCLFHIRARFLCFVSSNKSLVLSSTPSSFITYNLYHLSFTFSP